MTSEEVKKVFTVPEIIETELIALELRHANKIPERYKRRIVRRALTRAGFQKKDIPDSYKLLSDLPVTNKKKAGRAK